MRISGIGRILTLLALASAGTAGAAPPLGIGVMGDSYSDEYQFYPPDRTTARNWVEMLADTRGLDFGRFSTASRGEPRNAGYEYNWARSDATTDDLIATGQHTGLAAQVRRGEVQVVYLCIGGNDFIRARKAPDPLASLRATSPRALENVGIATETILAAHPEVRLIVATLPDIRDLPEFAEPARSEGNSGTVTAAFSAAIDRFNHRIRAIARGNERIALIDFDLTAKLANLIDLNSVSVGGFKLDRRRPGNEIDRFFLADLRHPGTMGQGLIAQLFVETLNVRFHAGIEPLKPEEIFNYASSVSGPARLQAHSQEARR